jgi:hypothetical protein
MSIKNDRPDVPPELLVLVRNLIEGWKAVDPDLMIDGLSLEEMEDPFASTEHLLAEMEKVTGQFRESYASLMDDVDELLNIQRNKFLQ